MENGRDIFRMYSGLGDRIGGERAMRWETVALLVFGFLCGMTVMYILNRRQRIQEFNKIAEITEDNFK